jgi:hypothetical protein
MGHRSSQTAPGSSGRVGLEQLEALTPGLYPYPEQRQPRPPSWLLGEPCLSNDFIAGIIDVCGLQAVASGRRRTAPTRGRRGNLLQPLQGPIHGGLIQRFTPEGFIVEQHTAMLVDYFWPIHPIHYTLSRLWATGGLSFVAVAKNVETGYRVPRVIPPAVLQRRVDGNGAVGAVEGRLRAQEEVYEGVVLLWCGRVDGVWASKAARMQEEVSALGG